MTQQLSSQKTGATPIVIAAPAAGEMLMVPGAGNSTLHFEFDTASSSFVRSENDLVVTVEGGGKVTLEEFFAVGVEGTLPALVLADGTVVAGADFLRAQSPDMDITTAAGPSQSSSSSGLGAYDDAAGDLMGGTDRLGSLGTDQWGRTTAQQETDAGLLTPAVAEAGPTPTPGPIPPVDNRIRYDARASIFTHDANAAVAEEVSFDGLSVNNIQWHNQAFQDLFVVNIDVNGKLTLKLSQAGLDQVAQAGTDDIYGYVTLATNKGTYTVQVVINENNSLNSHDLDQKTGTGVLAPGGLKHGEWHQGQDLKGGTLESSNLDDRVHYTGSVQNSSIFTGNGNDTITIDQYTSHGSVIDAGAGDNVLSFNDKSTSYDTSALWYGTTVKAGDGNNLISVEATSNSQATGYSAQTGGPWDASAPLTMTTGSGSDTLNIAVSTQGDASGVIDYNFDNGVFSTINLGSGNNRVNVDVYGGTYASGLEYGVKLTTGAGNDVIHITAESASGKGNALEGGSSTSQRTTVDAGNGNNEIVLSGISASGSARGMQSASVISGSGNDTIQVTATTTSNSAIGMENSFLNSGSGNDTLLIRGESTSGAARGMHNSSAVLQGSGTVQVQAQSDSNTAVGMYNSSLVMQQGTATVAATSNTGAAIGMYAQQGMQNAITTLGTVAVQAQSTSGNATGLLAENSLAAGVASKNIISLGEGGSHITAESTSGNAVALQTGSDGTTATGITITEITGAGDLALTASGAQAAGILTQASAVGSASSTKVDIEGNLLVAANVAAAAGANSIFGVLNTGRDDASKFNSKSETSLKAGTITIAADGNGNSDVVVGVAAHGGPNSTDPWWAYYKYNESHVLLEGASVSVQVNQAAQLLAQQTGNWSALAGEAMGLQSLNFSGIDVTASTLNIAVAGKTAHGLYSASTGGNPNGPNGANNIGKSYNYGIHIAGTDSADTFTVAAHSSGGIAAGIATLDVSPIIFDGKGGSDTLSITAEAHGATTADRAYGMLTGFDGQADLVHVPTGTSYFGGQYSTNSINNMENVSITAKSAGSSAYGMQAMSGDDSATSPYNVNKITNTAEALRVAITAQANLATGFGVGMSAHKHGANTIESGAGNDVITVSASNTLGEAIGMYAQYSGAKNSITTGSGNDQIIIKAEGKTARGLMAEEGGANTITSTGAATLAVTAQASSGAATGMHAVSGGSNTLNAGGTVAVNATTDTDMGIGLYANGAGANTINGVKVDITAKNNSGTQSLGVYSLGGGTNAITGTGAVTVDASSTTNAWGLYAGAGSQNNMGTTSALSVTATGVAGQAIAVAAKGMNAQNTLTGNGITLAATAGTSAVALNAEINGTNTVNDLGGGLTITASGGSSSSALNVVSGGRNVVHAAGDVDVVVTAASGTARAMQADGGTNTLAISTGLNIDVHNAAPGSKAIPTAALIAMNNGVNLIQANGDSTGLEIRITVTAGNGGKAYAMYADTLGENRIEGSEKADFISLKGDVAAIYGGRNSISTGAGNDHVVLDGAVNTGGLTLEMGEGYDVLTLKATDYNDFKDKYGAWLLELVKNPAFGVESIQIASLGDWLIGDAQNLLTFFADPAFAGIEVPHGGLPLSLMTELHQGTASYSDAMHVDMQQGFDGAKEGLDHSAITFTAQGNDMVRVNGDVAHTDLTFAGGGHDTLTVAGSLIDSHVTIRESTYTGTLHVEAGALEHTDMTLLGGTSEVTLHGNVDSYSSLVLGSGDDTLRIDGNFTGQAAIGAGNDLVTLHGSAHGGMVDGGAGNDTLVGDAGNNIFVGGAGHDVLTGGDGADTFVWKAGDAGTVGAPATDVVTDFNADDGDKLDLSQLLTDEARDNLDSYLNIVHANGNTVLNISTSGESTAGRFDQVIVLQNSNLTDEQLMQHILLGQ